MFKSTDIWTCILPLLDLEDLGKLRSTCTKFHKMLDKKDVLRDLFKTKYDINFNGYLDYSEIPKFFHFFTLSKTDFDNFIAKTFKFKPSKKLYSQRLSFILKYCNIPRQDLSDYVACHELDDETIYKKLERPPHFIFCIDNPTHLRLNYFMNFISYNPIATLWSHLESFNMFNSHPSLKTLYACSWLKENTVIHFEKNHQDRAKLYKILDPNFITVWPIVARDVDLFDPIFVYQNHFKFGFSKESIVKYMLFKNISTERLIAEIPSIFENYRFIQKLFSTWQYDFIKLLHDEGFPVLQHLEQFEKETCRHDICNIIRDKILV